MAFQGWMAWEVDAERRREVIAAEAARPPRVRQPDRPSVTRTLDLALRSVFTAIAAGR